MRVAVTGTPGTGKTTATERLDTDLDVLHLNDVIKEEGFSTGIDEDRGSLVADLDKLSEWLDGRDDVLFESHLAHHFAADRVIVLRAHPETIVERLRERGDDDSKAYENAESEALDVILGEAVEEHGMESVCEIETTDRDPDAVASEIRAVVDGEREPSAGTVSYIDWL
ncbi:adenylate kinase [Haloarcula hispanica N601]|uniref:Putative adenylate kinase n=3 Tax=Haloarcula hispanica TaxID=51589 RepID=V5TKL3_HALHI|nr:MULTISPECIES: adenylate kinase family protein [Haloarcula]AEM56728.1 nucleotide kinase [Haloarcula hispanica ATCC 33960]AHB65527.1 adenylate kinase [Haloarcula hispanica N601]KZX47827.1 adenylate kinase [Haloarcula sp. K1]MCJ0618593.1 adenylate kinase family protein [Haloarcula hispanica]RYJ09170.1 adenylate kinase [Haloarcula hispanica]